MSVEVNIYMNNIVKFFKENPKDLLNLVPKDKEDEFYDKIRKVAYSNYDKVEEAPLTQKQLIDVCVEINGKTSKKKPKLDDITFDTKFGKIFLN